MTIGVFADYLDYKQRFIAATACTEESELAELARQIEKHKATNVSGLFRYTTTDDGAGVYTPL